MPALLCGPWGEGEQGHSGNSAAVWSGFSICTEQSVSPATPATRCHLLGSPYRCTLQTSDTSHSSDIGPAPSPHLRQLVYTCGLLWTPCRLCPHLCQGCELLVPAGSRHLEYVSLGSLFQPQVKPGSKVPFLLWLPHPFFLIGHEQLLPFPIWPPILAPGWAAGCKGGTSHPELSLEPHTAIEGWGLQGPLQLGGMENSLCSRDAHSRDSGQPPQDTLGTANGSLTSWQRCSQGQTLTSLPT